MGYTFNQHTMTTAASIATIGTSGTAMRFLRLPTADKSLWLISRMTIHWPRVGYTSSIIVSKTAHIVCGVIKRR